MRFIKYLCIVVISLSGIYACEDSLVVTPAVTQSDYKVLFVGNSFTFYNDGVDFHLQNMLNSDSAIDSAKYLIQKTAFSSYTLEAHFADVRTLDKIKSDNWNFVVLQEQSTRPINNPGLFLEYAQKLDEEIKKKNAKTVLFMTWALKESPADIVEIASSYLSVGSQLDAGVAPVGKVWDTFQKANPLINLYFSDNKHPSLAGTYLVSCVFYYSLFNKNPVNNTYVPAGLTSQNAIAIRKGVYESLKED